MVDFSAEYDRCRRMTEEALAGCFTEELPQRELLNAMRYSLLAGGKRIRPILTLQFCKAVCGRAEPALDFACGVEMLHTYSLIHDDLPCMDNDDLRRGKPTCHKVFGECTATLAGDALQSAAFARIAGADLPAWCRAEGCAVLAAAAGAYGMCGGQQLDMAGEGADLTLDDLAAIHDRKTAALLEGACLLGLLAGGADRTDPRWTAARRYAAELGLAFQIRDDILDATSSTEVLGKPVGSDAANGKRTYVALLGIEACEALVHEHTKAAKAALTGAFEAPGFLCALADELAGRVN